MYTRCAQPSEDCSPKILQDDTGSSSVLVNTEGVFYPPRVML
jgi:hypothetical protein